METLVVISHLRWDFVYQRPQHLMTRLAKRYRVFFVEEPVFSEEPAHTEMTQIQSNLWVCRPHTPVGALGFHDDQLAEMQGLLLRMCRDWVIERPIVWLYTPMALPLIDLFGPKAVIYDCMDELSAFQNAPKQLLQRENALLKVANLVFTGGPSLHRTKATRHAAVHCFPSSVDAAHFAAGREPSNAHPEVAQLVGPRLGYFGVIDERIDIGLISQLAQARPNWQIIMVGPVVKIDPGILPRRANIHYYGQRPYSELPAFLAGWDVSLLPFALNDSTRFISPTKTLEYMVAEKPIVSTAVADVKDPYGSVVAVCAREDFVQTCETALHQSPSELSRSAERMRTILSRTSWDRTADAMHALIQQCDHAMRRPSVPAVTTRHPVVVIGAGPTGLSAAFHLGEPSLLLEQHARVGGWCRSIEQNGFTFDYAGHIMFSNDPYVHELYGTLLGDNVHWQNREAWIYSNDVHTRYPFQGALYGLPANVVAECLMGAIDARLASVSPGTHSSSPPRKSTSPSACKAESLTDCCADGVLDAPAYDRRPGAVRDDTPRNFEEFIYQVWGKGVAKHFALPYNRKLWAVPLEQMETSWLGGRVPLPNLQEMVEGALSPIQKPMGPNARFGYPLRGGFQALVDGFLPLLRGELKTNARVAKIFPAAHRLLLDDGQSCQYQQLISTMPLPRLVSAAGDLAPARVRDAAARLRHVSVRCVNLGVGRPHLTDKHWIYYPGDSVFHRIFVQGNASPHVNPSNGFGLTCEITYSADKPLPCQGEELIDRCIAECIKVGLFTADDTILARNQIDMPYAYVVYDHGRAENVAVVREWAEQHDIILAGRYSEWEYYNSDHAFLAGKKAALTALTGLSRSALIGGGSQRREQNLASAST